MINNININDILSLIPHRYPLLMVDRIIEHTDDSIVGIKNVTFNEPHFTGHFPDNPVMPGVLIVEALAQVSAILVSQKLNINKESKDNKLIYFMSIDDTKFRKVVIPGDCLVLKSKVEQTRGHVWKFTAQAEVDNNVVTESRFMAMIKDKE